MCRANLTTFGYKPTNRARTSASARNFAERNMPGCASWSWPRSLRSSKNGNVPNYNQARRRQVILPQKDWHLFQTSTCINCHAIRGVAGADLRVAPDLTHVGSRKQLGAGILENTPANMRLWLKSPQHIKPGALMPDFNFTDEQLDQLAAYLSTLQ